MLHQTQQLQNPFSFPCNPFSSPSKFSPSTLSSQVEKGMKCIVKSGSSTAKMVMDNEVCGVNNLSPPSWFLGEDLFVEDFFNFNNNNNISNNNNNDEFELLETVLETEQQQQLQPQQQQQQQQQPQVEQHGVEDKADNQNLFLSPPLDTAEEADLEWLSHFVEDSFCQCSTPLPPTYKPKNKPEPEPSGTEFPSIALGRSRRMKRGRTGGRVWSTSCYDSDSYSFSPPASPARKQHKKNNPPKKDTKPAGPGQRICSHCGTQRTPQWRQGPEGAKTLCNACGVRYKSGRLFPEYRPACSPTFSSELHSNSHRKVLEMRKDKGSS